MPISPGTQQKNISLYCHAYSDYIRRVLDWKLDLLDHQSVTHNLQCIHFTTHNHWVSSLPLKTLAPGWQPLLWHPLPSLTSLTAFTNITQSQSHITTDDQSVSASWFWAPSGAHDQMLSTVWQLLFCPYWAAPLMRGPLLSVYPLS
jgi:hypothetical protein